MPIGVSFNNHDVIIVDESLNEVQDGKIGEICFSGNQLSVGYLKDSNKTKNVFINFGNKKMV